MDDMKKLMDWFETSITEEEDDSVKYIEMAKSLPQEYAGILWDIAEEERTHRKHLSDILWDMQKKMNHHEEDHESEQELSHDTEH